jgi:hypothetical protein
MSTRLVVRAASMILGLAVLPAGCGLIDPDVTKLTFDLPTKTYHFDTSMWNVPQGTIPTVPCTAAAECCLVADCAATPIVCQAGACTALVPVSTHQMVNLSQEVPRLRGLTSLVNVNIEAIRYTVSNNSLNVDLPEVEIFLAPDGVTDASDSRARKFGTVPVIPAMMNPSGMIRLQPDAADVFTMFTSDLSVPFNFIARTTVEVRSGSPLPNGGLDIAITGTMSVSL